MIMSVGEPVRWPRIPCLGVALPDVFPCLGMVHPWS